MSPGRVRVSTEHKFMCIVCALTDLCDASARRADVELNPESSEFVLCSFQRGQPTCYRLQCHNHLFSIL